MSWGCLKGHNWMSYCITNHVRFCARVELFGTLTDSFLVFNRPAISLLAILCVYIHSVFSWSDTTRTAVDQRNCDEVRVGENQVNLEVT